MKARKRPKGQSPLDDPATFERIDTLLGALERDPNRFWRYEQRRPEDERKLICLYAALERPKDARSGLRHLTALRLSLSWQFPEEFGPAAPPHIRRQKLIGLIMGDAPPEARTGVVERVE